MSEVDFTLEKLSQVDDSGAFIIGIETVGSLKSVKEFIQVFPEFALIFQRITFDYEEPVRIGLIIVPESGFMREDGGCNLIGAIPSSRNLRALANCSLSRMPRRLGLWVRKGLHRGIGILSILVFDKPRIQVPVIRGLHAGHCRKDFYHRSENEDIGIVDRDDFLRTGEFGFQSNHVVQGNPGRSAIRFPQERNDPPPCDWQANWN